MVFLLCLYREKWSHQTSKFCWVVALSVLPLRRCVKKRDCSLTKWTVQTFELWVLGSKEYR